MEDHVEMTHAVVDQDMLEIIAKNLFARKLVKMEQCFMFDYFGFTNISITIMYYAHLKNRLLHSKLVQKFRNTES